MNKLIIKIAIIIVILLQCSFKFVYCQQRLESTINTSLFIPTIMKIKFSGLENGEILDIGKILKEKPTSKENEFEILIETNTPYLTLHFETTSENGNLNNSKNELETSYLFIEESSNSIIQGNWLHIKRKKSNIFKIEHPGISKWTFRSYVKLDSTSNVGTYKDFLNIILTDNKGKSYNKSFTIQCEVE